MRGEKIDGLRIIESATTGKANATLNLAFQFRLTDESGMPVEGGRPGVTVIEGAGSVVHSFVVSAFPGVYGAHVRLGAARNVFQIAAGGLTWSVTITGEP